MERYQIYRESIATSLSIFRVEKRERQNITISHSHLWRDSYSLIKLTELA
jgi:hypothetical protein